jgi:microcystin-dependent protein
MALKWTVEVRDSSLARVGQLSEYDLTDFVAVPRMNNLGSWTITLPNTLLNDDGVRIPHALCAALRTQGAGIIVTGPHGVVLTGPMVFAEMLATARNPEGVWTIQGVSDAVLLSRPTAFPDPSNSDPATQTFSNDVRTGNGEALMRAYVSANIGPTAPTARQIADLTLSADGGLGVTLSKSPRFQNLLELTQEIALGSDLLFDVVQVGSGREFRVSAPQDVSSLVRWDIANNQLSKSKYGYSAPGVTRVFVAGQGEGTARTIVEVTTPASLLSEAIWGRKERFIDQRNTNDVTELTQAGLEVLAKEGSTITSLEVVPSTDMAEGFGDKWLLGSWVTIVVNDQEVKAQVSETPISISPDGVIVGAVIGDATGFDWQNILDAKQTKTAQRVSALEQNAENGSGAVPPGAVQEFAGTTAPNGFLLCDGSLISRTTYATLFAVLGVVFGAGDGSTTFAVPNHAGRVAAGKGLGTFAALGATGGAETVTLTSSQIPAHSHNQTFYSSTLAAAGSALGAMTGGAGASATSGQTTLPNTGGGGSHNNLQPYIVMNFIIKT